jgi:hypothetical protein
MAIVHKAQGYEVFKEYWSTELEERGAAAKSIGEPDQQNVLSTIEIGLSPFVPFTERYAMETESLPSNGWSVGASPTEGNVDPEKWGKVLDTAVSPNLPKFGTDRIPNDMMIEAASNLARTISTLLQTEKIAKEATTTVVDELQQQALALYVGKTWDEDHYKTKGGASVIGKIKQVKESELKRLGGETWDMYAKGEAATKTLEMSLYMLHRKAADKDFVKGVRSMEVTTMQREKYFKAKFDEIKGEYSTATEALTKAAEKSIQDIFNKYDVIGKNIKKVYDSIPKATKKEGGREDLDYFAKQLTSRLYELQQGSNMFGGSLDLGNAFIFQFPLDAYSSAYVKVIPKFFKDGRVKSIKTKAEIIGGDQFKTFVDAAKVEDKAGAVHPVFHKASKFSYATHTQLLLWDLHGRSGIDMADLFRAQAVSTGWVLNGLASRGMRFDTIGTGLHNRFSVALGNIPNSLFIEGTEVIGKKDATDFIKAQVEGLLSAAKKDMVPELKKFYEDAMRESEAITSQWTKDIKMTKLTTASDPQGPYASKDKSAKLFTNERDLRGIGIPFWFAIGRDPTGFEKFKRKQTHEKASDWANISRKAVSPLQDPLKFREVEGARKVRGPIDALHPEKVLAGKGQGYGMWPGGRETAWDPTQRIVEGTGGWSTVATQQAKSVLATGHRTIEQILVSRSRQAGGSPARMREDYPDNSGDFTAMML